MIVIYTINFKIMQEKTTLCRFFPEINNLRKKLKIITCHMNQFPDKLHALMTDQDMLFSDRILETKRAFHC